MNTRQEPLLIVMSLAFLATATMLFNARAGLQATSDSNTSLRAELKRALNERDAAMETAGIGTETQGLMLDAVRCVESSCGADRRDDGAIADPCLTAVGPYQVRVPTALWLIKTDRLMPPPTGTSCRALRAALRTEAYGRMASDAYLRFLRENRTLGDAVAAYNCGPGQPARYCRSYVAAVADALE